MRTKTLTSVLFLLLSGAAFAQTSNPKVVVEIPACNKIWVGVDNPIKIMVEGHDSVSLDQVKVTNATITKEGDYFNLRPKEADVVEMTVTTTSHTDKHVFRAKPIEITPLFGAQYANGAVVGVGAFKAQDGIAAIVACCFEAKCDVEHFQVLKKAFRSGDRRVFNLGGRFTEETRRTIEEAQSGDVYLFYDITVRCPGDTESRNLGALQITIN